jgi:hypothetical protein
MGWLRQTTGGYAGGMLVLATGLVIAAGLVLTLKLPEEPRATSGAGH